MHVYTQNIHCDEWNDFLINSLPGDMTTSYACDTKNDTFTQLTDVTIPEKPHDTGNLRKVLQLKVGA